MTDTLRDLTYGRSTLQGGGGDSTTVQAAITEALLPDLDLFGDWETPFVVSTRTDPFGQLYSPEGEAPYRETGQILGFAEVLRDPYNLAARSIWDDSITGMTFANAKGTTAEGVAYDLRRGVFEIGAIVETAPNEVGDRTLTITITIFDMDTFQSIEFILFDQSILPTTAVRSTLQMVCPRLPIDLLALQTQAEQQLTAAGLEVSATGNYDGYLALRLHQTSGSDLDIHNVHFWLRKTEDLPAAA